MASTSVTLIYLKFNYHGKARKIALYKGLRTEELNTLLKATFGVSNEVAGVIDDENHIIYPISLLARHPETFNPSVSLRLQLFYTNSSANAEPSPAGVDKEETVEAAETAEGSDEEDYQNGFYGGRGGRGFPGRGRGGRFGRGRTTGRGRGRGRGFGRGRGDFEEGGEN
eukprot:scaffold3700_cov189-Ochromonas_danica.AAC.4